MFLNLNKPFILFFAIFTLMTLSSSGCVKHKETISETPDNDDHPVKEKVLSWDQQTLKRVSPINGSYHGYARLIQLESGELMCVFESDGNIVASKSTNEGQTWSAPTMIAAKASGVNMTVPDILKLSD